MSKPRHLPLPETRRRIVEEVHQELFRRWPDIFNPVTPKPLKIGIRADFRRHGISDRRAKKFLMAWTATPAYHQALLDYAHRYDLDGNVIPRTAEDLARDRRRLQPEEAA